MELLERSSYSREGSSHFSMLEMFSILLFDSNSILSKGNLSTGNEPPMQFFDMNNFSREFSLLVLKGSISVIEFS